MSLKRKCCFASCLRGVSQSHPTAQEAERGTIRHLLDHFQQFRMEEANAEA